MTCYSLESVKATILESQQLSRSHKKTSNTFTDSILDVVLKIRALQIDTLQMIRRSHYIAMWSRINNYSTTFLDDLCYGPNRRFFEYWYHAACVIPIEEFPYRYPMMKQHEEGESKRWGKWMSIDRNRSLVEEIMSILQNKGPQKTSNFSNTGPKRGAWWDWKPQKRALEHLYDSGKAIIVNRINFQKVYGLTENYLSEDMLVKTCSIEDSIIHDLEMSLLATGVCRHQQIADYTHMKRGVANKYVEELITSGIAKEISARNFKNEKVKLLIHKDKLNLLDSYNDGQNMPTRTTFLTPFDSLFWAKGRDLELFNFRQVLECYKPSSLRKWGYFCLPILHKGNLIGRFDPRLDRPSKTMHINALHLEPGVDLDDILVHDVSVAMKNFLIFHEAENISFKGTGHTGFIKQLERSL